jgi:hypothetical protein
MKNLNPRTPHFARDNKEACWDLPGAPETMSIARRLVRQVLTAWGLHDLGCEITLVMTTTGWFVPQVLMSEVRDWPLHARGGRSA